VVSFLKGGIHILTKINCWEYTKCGREIGGTKEDELGICSVVRNYTHRGLNGGRGAGRICWEVAGSLCHGIIQGTSAKKIMNCKQCGFFVLVKSEEGVNFRE
jgi:hypothetical protein